jgi:hypothetical protein
MKENQMGRTSGRHEIIGNVYLNVADKEAEEKRLFENDKDSGKDES